MCREWIKLIFFPIILRESSISCKGLIFFTELNIMKYFIQREKIYFFCSTLASNNNINNKVIISLFDRIRKKKSKNIYITLSISVLKKNTPKTYSYCFFFFPRGRKPLPQVTLADFNGTFHFSSGQKDCHSESVQQGRHKYFRYRGLFCNLNYLNDEIS